MSSFRTRDTAPPSAGRRPVVPVSERPQGGSRLLRFLALAATLAGAASVRAQEDPSRERPGPPARLHYEGGGDWYSNPSSMPNWMRAFQERTGTPTVAEEVQVRPTDDALFRYPIAYMNGHGNVSFSEDDLQALRRWLAAGGFLWA